MNALSITPAPSTTPTNYLPTRASLPLTFAPATEGNSADVVAVAGGPSWPSEALTAIRSGARGVIISEPSVVAHHEADQVRTLARQHGVAVEIVEPYAGDPSLSVHAEELSAHLDAVSAVVLTESTPHLSRQAAVLGVLRTFRALGLEPTVQSVTAHEAHVVVRGHAGPKLFSASVVRTRAQRTQQVQLLGFSKTVHITLHGSSNARPAHLKVTSMAGETLLPTVYESAERTSWQRLATALKNGEPHHAGLDGYLSDLAASDSP